MDLLNMDVSALPGQDIAWRLSIPESPPVWECAGALINLHGEDAIAWAQGYMVTAVQRGEPPAVRYMRDVIAAIVEMSRSAGSGEAIH